MGTKPSGWRLLDHPGEYDISTLGDTISIEGQAYKTRDLIFYKDRWDKTTKKSSLADDKYTLEEHFIVTYNKKYAEYQSYIREKKLERARQLIISNPGKIDTHNPRDPRYYISRVITTSGGEVAFECYYSIDECVITEESQYDGFYAVTTDLEDGNLKLIIDANKRR